MAGATPRGESSVSGVSSFSPDDDDLYLLQAHCGQCHASDARQPPGFLAGNNVMSRVAQCAPRILARLRAWQDRANSEVIPMPPPANVDADWPQGDHYRRLLAAVERLRDNRAASATVDSGAGAYPELDTCLAPGQPVAKPSRAG